MYRFVYMALFSLVFFTGCTPEYVPPKEAIPEIPAGRGGGGEAGAPGAASMPTKGSSGGPGKMKKPG